MDALPVTERNDLPFASKVTTTFNGQQTGVMHACGHDAHTAILLGVADALVAMRGELPGEVMLVFQPSEEGAPEGEEGGASLMLEEGLFADFKPEARSEEHTSELQSLMRISYAVFCLKHKINNNTNTMTITHPTH